MESIVKEMIAKAHIYNILINLKTKERANSLKPGEEHKPKELNHRAQETMNRLKETHSLLSA